MLNFRYGREALLAVCTAMSTAAICFAVMAESRVERAEKRNSDLEADIQRLWTDRDAIVDAVKSTSDIALKASERAAVLEAKQAIRETTGGP